MKGLTEYRIGNEAIYLGTGAAEFIHTNSRTGESSRFFGRVTGIEDRGEYLYVGYQPNDVSHNCRFGYFRLYKDGRQRTSSWRVTMA